MGGLGVADCTFGWAFATDDEKGRKIVNTQKTHFFMTKTIQIQIRDKTIIYVFAVEGEQMWFTYQENGQTIFEYWRKEA